MQMYRCVYGTYAPVGSRSDTMSIIDFLFFIFLSVTLFPNQTTKDHWRYTLVYIRENDCNINSDRDTEKHAVRNLAQRIPGGWLLRQSRFACIQRARVSR